MKTSPLPPPKLLKEQLPLLQEQALFVENARMQARAIFQKKDPRLAIIVGPCSLHEEKSAIEYADHICELTSVTSNHLFLVMRAYSEKPRTVTGWKGLLYDPKLDGSNNISEGIYRTRALFLELIKRKVPIATEFLDPLIVPYLDDLVCWAFIGARTSASQPHRQLASRLNYPIGFKNAVDGNIDVALHGIAAAQVGHSYIGIDAQGYISTLESHGNPFAHLVLRGSYTNTNYQQKSICLSIEKLRREQLSDRLIVDCSHGNSHKQHLMQKQSFYTSLEQILEGNIDIMGLMLESHLKEGSQPLSHPESLEYGVSITDPCLNIEDTKELLLCACTELSKRWCAAFA